MASKLINLLIYLLSMVNYISTKSTPDSNTYKAGVVEFYPSNGNLLQVVERNLNHYLVLINDAKIQDVDILVFPEATLNRDWIDSKWSTYAAIEVPSKEEEAIPCNEKGKYSSILEHISCAAADSSMYIVINVGEQTKCPKNSTNKCTAEEDVFFNTNVVFDRKGKIISKYRKINLYGENGFIEALDDSYETFDTDFNVTFGHFICFDLMFQKPSIQVVEKGNVSNVIFPTMWFSELPSLTAVEIQQSYAYSLNINFLAAGANNPVEGSTGSGIYSGKIGALNSTMNGLNKTELLISEVPKIPGQIAAINRTSINKKNISEMETLYLKTNDMKAYKYESVNLTKQNQTIILTYDNSSCEFYITINTNVPLKHYEYKAIMFDGVRSFDFKNGGIFECLIVACTSNEFSSCAKRFTEHSKDTSNIEFVKIEISASVATPILNTTTQSSNSVYYPVSLTTEIMPLSFEEYEFETIIDEDRTREVIKMIVEKPKVDFLSFGIFGRKFGNDHLPVTGTANRVINGFFIFQIFIGIVICLLPKLK